MSRPKIWASQKEYHSWWATRNREYLRVYHKIGQRKRRLRRRVGALLALGGKCVRCGFDSDYRALQLDHINSDGFKDNKKYWQLQQRIYAEIIDGKHKDKYQILCANCNWIKRYELEEHSRVNDG